MLSNSDFFRDQAIMQEVLGRIAKYDLPGLTHLQGAYGFETPLRPAGAQTDAASAVPNPL